MGYNLGMKQELMGDNQDGLTVSLGGKTPENGYAYSEQKGAEILMPENGDLAEIISLFINEHHEELRQPGIYVGIWKNGGKYYIDIVRTAMTEVEALERAKQHGQEAIYDLHNHKIIPVG